MTDKKVMKRVVTSPRIVSQIELLKMAKSGNTDASKEIMNRLSCNSKNSGEQSHE